MGSDETPALEALERRIDRLESLVLRGLCWVAGIALVASLVTLWVRIDPENPQGGDQFLGSFWLVALGGAFAAGGQGAVISALFALAFLFLVASAVTAVIALVRMGGRRGGRRLPRLVQVAFGCLCLSLLGGTIATLVYGAVEGTVVGPAIWLYAAGALLFGVVGFQPALRAWWHTTPTRRG